MAICLSLKLRDNNIRVNFVFLEGARDINSIVSKIRICPKVLIEIVSEDIHRPGSVPLTC